MKKILFLLALAISVMVPLTPSVLATNATDIIAYPGTSIDTTAPLPKIENKQQPEQKINHILYSAITIILMISGFIAVIIVLIGGVQYTMSAGVDDMVSSAKKKIIWALGGLLVILFSYAILTNVVDFLETSGNL